MSDLEDQLAADLTALRRDHDNLLAFAGRAIAEAVVARRLGPEHVKLFAPTLEKRIRLQFTPKGDVDVWVMLENGRYDFRADNTGKVLRATLDDLADDFAKEFADVLKGTEAVGDKPIEDKPTERNLTAEMVEIRRRQREAAAAPLTEQERASARSRNPFARETFNLTEQMRLKRKDSNFAIELERAAAA